MASSSRYKGVSRNQEVKVDQRRVDTRRWAEVVKDEAGTPSGTITIFAVMLFGCALLCWLPFAAELIFIFALLFYRKHYNYRNPHLVGAVSGSGLSEGAHGPRFPGRDHEQAGQRRHLPRVRPGNEPGSVGVAGRCENAPAGCGDDRERKDRGASG
jgi:hypothetical protein